MQFSCPSCSERIEIKSVPTRQHTNDGSEAWICLKCSAIICVECYYVHVAKQHPDMVQEIKKKKK